MTDKLKAIANVIWADVCDTYKRLKILIFAILAAVVYLEWEKISAAFLVYMANKSTQKDKTEDKTLYNKETSQNTQANALIQEAEGLPSQEQPVKDGWDKNQ